MTYIIDSKLECRIKGNPHFARVLRQRLEKRHAAGTRTREMLDRLSDDELVETYLRNDKVGRDHATKQRVEKGASE